MNRRHVGALLAGGLVAVAALGCAVGPGLIERRVERLLRAGLADAVDADVAIGGIGLAIWSDLPRVGLVLTDVVVTNRAPFEGTELARLPRVELGIDLLSAISGSTLTIERAYATGATVAVVYDASGRANWDVLARSDSDEEPYRLRLEDVALDDLRITWADQATGLLTEVEDVDVQATADLTQDVATVVSRGTVASLTVTYGGITWLRATRWASNMTLAYDQHTGGITFGENAVTVNALPLSFQGTAVPEGEDWRLDLDVAAPDATVAALLSLVPEAYGDSFDQLDAAGSVRLTASIEGLYKSEGEDLPAMNVDAELRDGRFRFPGLSSAVDHVSATIAVRHPEGPPDGMVLDLTHLALTAGGASATGRVHLDHPSSDPNLDLALDGRVDLGALRRALPAAAGAPEVDGVVDLDVAIAGRMSDFRRQAVDAVRADGAVRGKGLRFDHAGAPVDVRELDLELSPRLVRVNALSGRYRGSDVHVAGELVDLLPWWLTDTPLRGALALQSDRLDLRPWQGGDDAGDGDDAGALVAIPTDLDLTLKLAIGTLQTTDFRIDDLRGVVATKDGTLRLDDVRGRTLGGRVTLDGTYAAPTVQQADLALSIGADQLDVVDTVAAFESLLVIAPVLGRAIGAFDGTWSVKTSLGPDGSPDLSHVTSAGAFRPRKVRVQSAALEVVASQLARGELATMQLDGVEVGYAFERGRVDLVPFTASLGPQPATVGGRWGPLDRALDIRLDLPMKTSLIAGLPLLASFGAALPDTADVVVQLEGTLEKPKVKVGLSGKTAEAAVDAALDPLVAAATEQGDKLVEEARAAAQKLLDEASIAADAAVAAAAKQARQLRRDARGDPLRYAAADAAARLVEVEGEKASKRLLGEAEKQADNLVKVARERRDALIAEAEAKARAGLKGGR